jgi:hypothetical protein
MPFDGHGKRRSLEHTALAQMLAEDGTGARATKQLSKKHVLDYPNWVRIEIHTYKSILEFIRMGMNPIEACYLHGWDHRKFWDAVDVEFEAIRQGIICKNLLEKLSKRSKKSGPRVRRGPLWKVERESFYRKTMDAASEIQSKSKKP